MNTCNSKNYDELKPEDIVDMNLNPPKKAGGIDYRVPFDPTRDKDLMD
jgi:hypothetical protein